MALYLMHFSRDILSQAGDKSQDEKCWNEGIVMLKNSTQQIGKWSIRRGAREFMRGMPFCGGCE